MSTVGVSNITKCPACGLLLEEMRFTSGNTLYAKYWSDAKTEAPMLPSVPFIIKCPQCGEVFYPREHYHDPEPPAEGVLDRIARAMRVFDEDGEEGGSWMAQRRRDDSMQRRISEMNLPNTMECQLDFDDTVRAFDRIKSKASACFMVWHTFNDFYRSGDREGAKQREAVFRTFVPSLMDTLGDNDNDTLLRAELYRELGQCGKCVEILDGRMFRERFAILAQQVREKALGGETEVFIFDFKG